MSRSSRGLAGALMGLAALLLGAVQTARAGLFDAFGGATVDRIGPFELRLHHASHWIGAWESKTHTVRYSIRYHGKDVELPAAPGPMGEDGGRASRFDQVLAFTSPRPALLVGSGSATYAHHLWLLHEDGGVLRIERVGDQGSQAYEHPGTIEWLDGAPLVLPRAEDTRAVPRPVGGRWLVAGRHAVIDTQTLKIHPLAEPSVRVQDLRVLWRSPDGLSFVRAGVGEGYPVSVHLVVFDLARGTSEALPLDQRRMRYVDTEELHSTEWLTHHFQWVVRTDGGYRLAARTAFRPWPRRGQLIDRSNGKEYVIAGIGPDALQRWLRCVERKLGGREVTHRDPAAVREDGGETIDSWRYVVVGSSTLAVLLTPDGELRVWPHRGDDDSLVAKVAAACEPDLHDES